MSEAKGYEGWAILEVMGHRRLAGLVSEAVIAGAAMVRIDVPSTPPATQFYGGASIFCLTPTTEEAVRKELSRYTTPARYELEPARMIRCDGDHEPPPCADPECWTVGDDGIPDEDEDDGDPAETTQVCGYEMGEDEAGRTQSCVLPWPCPRHPAAEADE